MPTSNSTSSCCAVHPHGRGDNRWCTPWSAAAYGSPPRAWGQLVASPVLGFVRRFTPTGVGTMPTASPSPSPTSVHLHGRGDNSGIGEPHHGSIGSPPRAWGQYCRSRSVAQKARFTPTGVGTICRSARVDGADAVHPHGRGDNFLIRTPALVGDGSPPRAWGQ